MKKSLLALSFVLAIPTAYSQDIQLDNLTKDDVEDVSVEFGGNFAHTAVAAPETDGAWGIEVGVAGGKTKSPNFSDLVDASGGDGSDFTSIYHAGAMARVHLPFDIFAEATMLPEREFDNVKIKSQSFGVGWNAGGFFSWPLDVAIGLDHGTGEVKFHQEGGGTVPETDVKLETKTTTYWLGISKSFWLITPYAKIGQSKIEGELQGDASIFDNTFSTSTKEKVNLSGTFMAAGLNFQLFFIKLGAEISQISDARRFSGKLSFDF